MANARPVMGAYLGVAHLLKASEFDYYFVHTIILIWFSQDKFCHLEADGPKFLGFTIARRIGQKSWAPVPIFFVLTEFGLNGTDVGSRFRRINRFRIDFSGQRIDPSEERMRASARSCGTMAHGTYWPLKRPQFDAWQLLNFCGIELLCTACTIVPISKQFSSWKNVISSIRRKQNVRWKHLSRRKDVSFKLGNFFV